MKTKLIPNFEVAKLHLAALDGRIDAKFTFQTFPDNKDQKNLADAVRPQLFHGTLEQHFKTLVRLNQLGAGIFVTVNETDGRGRKESNITSVRSVFADKDDGSFSELPLKPSLVVQTKNGEHAYWCVKSGTSKEEYRAAQKAIIASLGTDRCVHDLPRVMRLAGFYHQKILNDAFLATVKTVNNIQYTIAEVFQAFPKISADTNSDKRRGNIKRVKEQITIPLDQIPNVLSLPEPYNPPLRPDMEAVLRGCGFIKYCDENRLTLSEADWYKLAGILSFLENGREHFHSISCEYSKYSKLEADEKFDHARSAVSGPRTCSSIYESHSACPQCPHFERIHSPVQIGINAAAGQIVANMLDNATIDPGLPFERESLLALSILKENDSPEFARTMAQLKAIKIPQRQLEGELKRFQRTASQSRASAVSKDGTYAVVNGSISRKKWFRDLGETVEPLCNFDAKITSQVTSDDGVEKKRSFELEGSLSDGTKLNPITVPAIEFSAMNWVTQHWGIKAIIFAGQAIKDHLRAAIQKASMSATMVEVYAHTGWRNIGDKMAFLHGRGAILTTGNTCDVQVILGDDRISSYCFPDPPIGELLHDAVRSSLRFLDLGPIDLTAPIFAAIYRASLGEVLKNDFSVFLVGATGIFKTELAAIAQAHFGKNFSSRNLPGNWTSTANALERQAFLAKDVLFVIDDFSPRGGQRDVSELHSKAERVLRAAGNSAGRGRMGRDGGLRASNPPRALVLSTGEDIPTGHSLRARTFIVEVAKDSIRINVLGEMQSAARDGKLVLANAAYIHWLASHIEKFKLDLPEMRNQYRTMLERDSSHRRTIDATANLLVGLRVFFDFTVDVGAVQKEDSEILFEMAMQAIIVAAETQDIHQGSEDHLHKFFTLLGAAFVSGQAHVVDAKNPTTAPEQQSRWGWGSQFDSLPRGHKIGWIYEDELWLDPEPTMNMLYRMSQGRNDGLGFTKNRIGKMLAEKGVILSEKQPSTNSVRNTVKREIDSDQQTRQRYWVFPNKTVFYPYLEHSTIPVQESPL